MPARTEFDRARFWIGRHTGDGDVLVYDPETADPASANLVFFSMRELRPRVFPPAVVRERLEEIADPAESAEVAERYRGRTALREERDQEREQARGEVSARQRAQVIERHKALLESHGVPYTGVRDSAEAGRRSARTVCPVCRIALDDFAGVRCGRCSTLLCSCGGCACLTPGRFAAPAAAAE